MSSEFQTIDDTIHKSLIKESDSMMDYMEQRRYSSLHKIGYTPEEIDQYTGKVLVRTKWSPHPRFGYKIPGTSKIWSPVEWWVYNEWIKTDEKGRTYGIALSPAQQLWAKAWSNLSMKQCYISGGRDSGKSFLGSLFTLWCMTFLNEIYPNFLVSLFAGAKEQTGTVYETHVIPQLIGARHINDLLSQHDILHEIATGKKTRVGLKAVEMKFTTGARLIVNTASTRAARSKHPDLLWIDEVVEAEGVQGGQVISSAVSSLTAGHLMRVLGTSTVHRNPLGWFSRKIQLAKRMMDLGHKDYFYTNLSEAGLLSKTWTTKEAVEAELAMKASDPSINLEAEFYGKVIDAGGDIFDQDGISRMKVHSPPPRFNPDKHHLIAHDPGHGSSLYGLVVLQYDERTMEVPYSEFWYRTSPKGIMERVKELDKEWQADMHAVDAAATGMIFNLQDANFDVLGVPLGARPSNKDVLTVEEIERSYVDNKTIGINWINNLLADDKMFIYEKAGCFKPIRPIPGDLEWYGNQLLIAQMQQYKENEQTGKPMKGNDDMIDALLVGTKIVVEQGNLGGFGALIAD